MCTLTFLSFLSFSTSLHAALRTWVGGGASNSWGLSANWQFGIPPGLNDDVTIPTGFSVVIDADVSVHSIMVQGTSSLLVESGNTLTLNHGSQPFGINLLGNSSLDNQGTIVIDDASTNGILALGSASVDNSGTITINDSDGTANDAAIVIADGQFSNTGDISGSGFDNLISYSGTSGSFNNNSGGTLAGTGDVDADVFNGNGGTILPGTAGSPGTMNFTGTVDLSNTTIRIEIEAFGTAGTDYGQITIDGDVTLGGTAMLIVEWIGMGIPMVGNTFSILTPTMLIIGDFAMPITLPDCCDWTLDLNGGSGPVSIVVGTILPVELTGFWGKAGAGEVSLFWETGGEQNNTGWEVEHSIDGHTWSTVGFVTGAGTTSLPRSYTYTHQQPALNGNYYRLRQIDWDGNHDYSPILSVVVPETAASDLIRVYPNPARPSGSLTINIQSSDNPERVLKVYHLDGRQIYEAKVTSNTVQFRYEGWTEGIYLFALETGKSVEIFRVFVRRD